MTGPHKRQKKLSDLSEAMMHSSTREQLAFPRKIHFRKRSSRRDQRLSVTDLMALGKLRPAGNQDEGHDTPEQAVAINQSSSSRMLVRKA